MAEETKKPPKRKELSIFGETLGSVKTLRQFYKKNPTVPTLDELKGENDRSIILIMATLLDDGLALRIADCLHFKPTDDEKDYIFRFEGPLGTFSAKMEVALYFHCIDDVMYQQLDIVTTQNTTKTNEDTGASRSVTRSDC